MSALSWVCNFAGGKKQAFRVFGVLAAVVMLSLPGFSQLNTGRLSGTVTDQTGGAIGGATVVVTETATGVARTLMTDASGAYAAPNLTPGTYSVHAEYMGFQAYERQNIQVGTGSDIRADVTLQPGQQTQTVTVTESLPLINTTNAQTGGTLQQQLLANLPVNGRNYRWMIEFVPGIMTTPGEGTVSSSTNGGGTDWANFMIDGLYDQSPYSKQSSVGGAGEAGDTTLMPLDAIQEVALVTNPKAEYGWDPGVTMNVNLKSGTNAMHGSAYAFGRDTSFDARNAFSTERGPVEFEQWGATLGGPIKKDKLFYFGGYESERVNVTSDQTITSDPTTADLGSATNATQLSIPDAIFDILKNGGGVPKLSQLSTNMAGCNYGNIVANAGAIVAGSGATVAPFCNGAQSGAAGLFNNTSTNTAPSTSFPQYGGSDNFLGKIDYHLSDHHSLSGSYFFARYHEFADASATMTQPYWDEVLSVRSQDVRVVEIWTPNSSWLNEARVGWDHDSRPVTEADCAAGGSTNDPLGLNSTSGQNGSPVYNTAFGLVSGAPACGIPTIKFTGSGAPTATLGFGNNRLNFESDWQGADTVSYTHGNHQFKFGVDVRAESFNGVKVQDQQRGTVSFGNTGTAAFSGATPLEDFLAGAVGQETIKLGNPIRTVRYDLIAGFAQDDWRIKPRLTLNLGFRWEMQTPMKDDNGLLANFAPGAVSGMVQSNQLWPNQFGYLPHVGFAWDVTGKGTTTVRSSIGDALVVPQVQNWITAQTDDLSAMPTGATLVYPNNALPSIAPIGNINNSLLTLTPPLTWQSGTAIFPSSAALSCSFTQQCTGYGADPHVKFPQMLTWNLNVQHAFTNNLSLDVGYIGSHAWDITGLYNLNEPTPGVAGSGAEKLRQPYYTNCDAAQGVVGTGGSGNQCFPWFANIAYIGDVGGSNYAALQVYLNERASHGLTFSIGYTLSHALGIQGGPGTGTGSVLNNNCPQCEYGNLNTDATHHFSLTATYNIPGRKGFAQMLQGWAVNSSVNYLSGLPMNIADTNLDTSGTEGLLTNNSAKIDRWTLYGPQAPFNDILGGAGTIPCFGLSGSTFAKSGVCTTVTAMPQPCISAANGEPNGTGTAISQLNAVGCYMVNGSAIVPPAQGTFGNMTRNELRGKPIGIWNASVTKDWRIKEKLTTQFRAEFFNLVNSTFYAAPGLSLGNPKSFGLASSTPDVSKSNPVVGSGGPREIQLGLKFIF